MPRVQAWSHRMTDDPVLVYPDGCMDLVWDADGVVHVAGPDTGPRQVVRPAGSTVSGVRFDPGVLPALLCVPADELTDELVPLADVVPRQRLAAVPRLRLDDIADAAARLTVEPWVPLVVGALADGVPVADIADRLGVSERTLHRRACAAFGYGPRRLQVILRAGRAIDLVRSGVDLSDTAAAAGYADYAHLYRDVVRLTGRRPAEFRHAQA
ncbi:AraC family transcriptional regulator [Gordonia spumicola]|uniref:AraC family transcriptional regulator n=1 Tax=Gordonia spumicola TaxID=589161 RepID=A0A7I9V742_9ACTN|nr:helix-turn-helix domain-containing protein [Gordonia spumicola]GEE01216.1 AraC family transcriptional regulator [Gordonia spumicola]